LLEYQVVLDLLLGTGKTFCRFVGQQIMQKYFFFFFNFNFELMWKTNFIKLLKMFKLPFEWNLTNSTAISCIAHPTGHHVVGYKYAKIVAKSLQKLKTLAIYAK
jgi:hypothetical protein